MPARSDERKRKRSRRRRHSTNVVCSYHRRTGITLSCCYSLPLSSRHTLFNFFYSSPPTSVSPINMSRVNDKKTIFTKKFKKYVCLILLKFKCTFLTFDSDIGEGSFLLCVSINNYGIIVVYMLFVLLFKINKFKNNDYQSNWIREKKIKFNNKIITIFFFSWKIFEISII